MIDVTSSGSFGNIENYLRRMQRREFMKNLNRYGQEGVTALANATPMDSGLTKQSWKYRIVKTRTGHAIEWYNTNDETGMPVAITIQYGRATKNGGYIEGVDYINPAIRSLFDRIVSDLRREVTR